MHLRLNLNKHSPLDGSLYTNQQEDVKLKRAELNVKNNDIFCSLWNILLVLFPTKQHPETPRSPISMRLI